MKILFAKMVLLHSSSCSCVIVWGAILTPKMLQASDLKSFKTCTCGLMCSQGAPKSGQDINISNQKWILSDPQGLQFDGLGCPKCPQEEHVDAQRAFFGPHTYTLVIYVCLQVGTPGPPRPDFVICWTFRDQYWQHMRMHFFTHTHIYIYIFYILSWTCSVNERKLC